MDLQPAPRPRLQMQQGVYRPQVGTVTTVDLPGERTRAEIVNVVADDAIIARLQSFTVSREHRYKKGDLVPCRLVMGPMNQKIWQAVDEAELARAPAPNIPEPEESPEGDAADASFSRGEN